MKHTPGPWTYSPILFHGDTGDPGKTPFSVDGEGFRPALILGDGKSNRGTAEANARLIAAAPELLAAAELAIKLLRTMTSEEFAQGADAEVRQALCAAIAKSTR